MIDPTVAAKVFTETATANIASATTYTHPFDPPMAIHEKMTKLFIVQKVAHILGPTEIVEHALSEDGLAISDTSQTNFLSLFSFFFNLKILH